MEYDDLPRVAAVLDGYTVVVSAGADSGIGSGQRFVLFTLGNEVKDPVSGKSLGELEVVRGTGRAIHVQEKMCTVTSTEKRRTTRANVLTGGLSDAYEDAPFDEVEVGDYARPI